MKSTRSSGDDQVSRSSRASRGSTLLLTGGALTATGLAAAGTVAPRAGAVILVIGWVVFAYALHRFGHHE